MIVKQVLIGWIGVVSNNICTNGSVEFDVNMFGDSQLKPYIASYSELLKLQADIRINQPHLGSHIRLVEQHLCKIKSQPQKDRLAPRQANYNMKTLKGK